MLYLSARILTSIEGTILPSAVSKEQKPYDHAVMTYENILKFYFDISLEIDVPPFLRSVDDANVIRYISDLTGDMIDEMSDEQLAGKINSVSIIYRSTPRHKMKVIKVSV